MRVAPIAPKSIHPDMGTIIQEYCDFQIQHYLRLATNPKKVLDYLPKDYQKTVTNSDIAEIISSDIATFDKVRQNPKLLFALDDINGSLATTALWEFRNEFEEDDHMEKNTIRAIVLKLKAAALHYAHSSPQ